MLLINRIYQYSYTTISSLWETKVCRSIVRNCNDYTISTQIITTDTDNNHFVYNDSNVCTIRRITMEGIIYCCLHQVFWLLYTQLIHLFKATIRRIFIYCTLHTLSNTPVVHSLTRNQYIIHGSFIFTQYSISSKRLSSNTLSLLSFNNIKIPTQIC